MISAIRPAVATVLFAALAVGFCGGQPRSARAEERLAVFPAKVMLTGPEARQRLVVETVRDGQLVGDVSGTATYEISHPEIVRIEQGVVVPLASGAATITARVGDRTATAEVCVASFDAPFVWSFRNHVESVLVKGGCNSGACHGAAAGKNGFRLSLRGYHAEGDFVSLTRDARGRRIIPGDPGRSLLLTKPTGLVPHRGGVRFDADSLEYRVLAEWIAAGSPAPEASDPRIVRIEVLPSAVVLPRDAEQQLLVLAHFSDGRVEEVTRWAKLTATNESVAKIDDQGRVKVTGHGEGAITAWYLSQVAVATVASPYPHAVDPGRFAEAPRRNLIDERVLEKLAALNIPPSPRASDSEFVRRVYLDLIGTLPTAAEAQAFLADAEPTKRDRLIETLLARPEFVDFWTYKFCDLLLVNSEKLPPQAMWSYYHWIRRQVASNTPWNQVARELVTARGGTLENGAANFFLLHQDPLDLSETLTVAMLGFSMNCARCHNHPLEKWTNDQYYGLANLLARVRTKNQTSDADRAVFDASEGDLIQPVSGKAQPPTPLEASPLAPDAAIDRRDYLADWLTSPENEYFSRAITNRVWTSFLGVGLVEAVDDMRRTNPASNEPLLHDLSEYLVAQSFDLRALMRLIVQSETYQRSSQPLAENAADTRFYSRYYPRRLMAEVLLDAVSQVTAAPTAFPDYPSGWRAIQLPDANVPSYFLKTFGRPDRSITCECERTAEPSMVQVLHLANGDVLNAKLSATDGRIARQIASGASNEAITDEAIIDELFLTALARPATADERARLTQALAEAPAAERRAAVEDLYWGVLSSKEFLFNH